MLAISRDREPTERECDEMFADIDKEQRRSFLRGWTATKRRPQPKFLGHSLARRTTSRSRSAWIHSTTSTRSSRRWTLGTSSTSSCWATSDFSSSGKSTTMSPCILWRNCGRRRLTSSCAISPSLFGKLTFPTAKLRWHQAFGAGSAAVRHGAVRGRLVNTHARAPRPVAGSNGSG
ncbi:unnamed protein product [Phaeothamnion confervicola]